jgi:hypothetical protein
MAIAKLTDAFRVYLDEMDRCVTGQCYWALLHLVVVVAGICGALEAAAGEATKAGYIDWYQRMFPPAPPAPLRAEAGDAQHQLLGPQHAAQSP